MVISIFKVEHAMTSYVQPGGPAVTKQYIHTCDHSFLKQATKITIFFYRHQLFYKYFMLNCQGNKFQKLNFSNDFRIMESVSRMI